MHASFFSILLLQMMLVSMPIDCHFEKYIILSLKDHQESSHKSVAFESDHRSLAPRSLISFRPFTATHWWGGKASIH